MEGDISIDCTPNPFSRKIAIQDARAETKLTSNEKRRRYFHDTGHEDFSQQVTLYLTFSSNSHRL